VRRVGKNASLTLEAYILHHKVKCNAVNKVKSPLIGCLLTGCGIVVALMLVLSLVLFRVYGVDSHHTNRNSIWWSARGRSLIPPTATDITLQQDLLDHYATYTVAEQDLNAFLNRRFALNGSVIDSFSERGRPAPKKIGNAIGRLGWIVTKDTVVYDYTASNGGVHTYYHDPTTGRTYQSSAYW